MSTSFRVLSVLACFALAGCPSSDPTGPQESDDLRFGVRGINAADISGGMLARGASVAAEPGNPWGGFLSVARSGCGGDPDGFDVTVVAVGLDRPNSSVESLDEVFSDDVAVYLRDPANPAQQVHLATGKVLGTGAEFEFTVPGDLRTRLAAIHSQLLAGTFEVAISGLTDKVPGDTFSVDVRVRLRMTASCG